MASTFDDWRARYPYPTLNEFAFICCGWNPERARGIPPDVELYHQVRQTILMAVRVRDIPIIDDLCYTAADPAPTGHALTLEDVHLSSNDEQAQRAERGDDTATRVSLAAVWQWAKDQFPDTFDSTSDADAPHAALGKQLSDLRNEARLTIEELADLVNIDLTNVKDHLAGKVQPRLKNVRAYEKLFSDKLKRPTLTLTLEN